MIRGITLGALRSPKILKAVRNVSSPTLKSTEPEEVGVSTDIVGGRIKMKSAVLVKEQSPFMILLLISDLSINLNLATNFPTELMDEYRDAVTYYLKYIKRNK